MTKAIPHDTPIAGLGGATVGDFWSWAYSDVATNTVRCLLAEYLVARALGVSDGVRVEWDAVDLHYCGRGIEVKSSGYVQSWKQIAPSRIKFDIKQRLPWDSQTNTLGDCLQRAADCYVFCVHTARGRDDCRVLDIAQWEFYVMRKSILEAAVADQKSIALSRLQQLCRSGGCGPLAFGQIRKAVDEAIGAEFAA